jgi:hypothetical protein
MDARIRTASKALAGRRAIEREIGGGGMATFHLAEDPPVSPHGRDQCPQARARCRLRSRPISSTVRR